MLNTVKNWYKKLPDRKPWIDLATAVLSIPVLVTVIIINIGNLKKEGNANDTNKSSLAPTLIPDNTNEHSLVDDRESPTPVCNLDPAPYEIIFPKEGENVYVDPVCISLNKLGENFCTTQWAYRINNSSWSTYTSDPICLYNMAGGAVTLDIRMKSTLSGREKTYTRKFTYGNPVTPSQTFTGPSITP